MLLARMMVRIRTVASLGQGEVVLLARPAGPRRGLDDVTSTDLPGKRILIIEDYEDSAQVLCLFLLARGHRVEVASTGAEGFARARAFVPDVILSDLGLPDEDGFAVARRIRADDGLRNVWLIALTAYSVPNQAFAAGFDDYMTKPVNLERLAALIDGPPPARQV